MELKLAKGCGMDYRLPAVIASANDWPNVQGARVREQVS